MFTALSFMGKEIKYRTLEQIAKGGILLNTGKEDNYTKTCHF